MSNLISNILFLLVAFVVSFYTLTYARWLWHEKNIRGALGVILLALISFFYSGFVLFFGHK
ncbi:MAG: hypothetical protein PHI90_07130 [Clostridia bacterium]|nr:hypothetical protein [Clostridia bacterium]MDD4048577.1 hypothetical protein [Clostridia bacterium]